jgi:hypothetical protein
MLLDHSSERYEASLGVLDEGFFLFGMRTRFQL